MCYKWCLATWFHCWSYALWKLCIISMSAAHTLCNSRFVDLQLILHSWSTSGQKDHVHRNYRRMVVNTILAVYKDNENVLCRYLAHSPSILSSQQCWLWIPGIHVASWAWGQGVWKWACTAIFLGVKIKWGMAGSRSLWPWGVVILGGSDGGSNSTSDLTFHTGHLIPNLESGLANGKSHFLRVSPQHWNISWVKLVTSTLALISDMFDIPQNTFPEVLNLWKGWWRRHHFYRGQGTDHKRIKATPTMTMMIPIMGTVVVREERWFWDSVKHKARKLTLFSYAEPEWLSQRVSRKAVQVCLRNFDKGSMCRWE
jgi:hypothetical protein